MPGSQIHLNREVKHAILRQVYEDNLGFGKTSPRPSSKTSTNAGPFAPARRAGTRLIWLATVLLLLAVAAPTQHNPSPQVIALQGSRITQELAVDPADAEPSIASDALAYLGPAPEFSLALDVSGPTSPMLQPPRSNANSIPVGEFIADAWHMNLAALGPPPPAGISSEDPLPPIAFQDLWHKTLWRSNLTAAEQLQEQLAAPSAEPFLDLWQMQLATGQAAKRPPVESEFDARLAEPFQDLFQLRLTSNLATRARSDDSDDVIPAPDAFRDVWHIRLAAVSESPPPPTRASRSESRSEFADKVVDSGWLDAYRLAAATTLQRSGETAPPLTPTLFAVPADDPGKPADYRALTDEPDLALATLFGLKVKTIMIDPGHGGRDPGAVGHSGLREKDVTLDIARRLRVRLAQHGKFRTLMTRDGDTKMSLRQRVEYANSQNVDLFISVHVNYLPVEPPTVIETYYFGPHQDPTTLALAEKENRDSDYTMGDFKPMIRKIGDTFKYQESRTLAESIQTSLYQNMKRHNDKIIDVGIKTAPFVVLLGVEMPSVLAEVTCISNKQEERRLATAEYRDNIARYLEQGIVAYLEGNRHDTDGEGVNRYARKRSSEEG